MKNESWAKWFSALLRIFLGVALAMIVVAAIYPQPTVQGPPGKTGATGAAGASVKGDPGKRGPAGADGTDGQRGNTGATGASGRFWGK